MSTRLQPTAPKAKDFWTFTLRRAHSVAFIAPAVRTVILEVTVDGEHSWVEIYHVLAIQAVIENRLEKPIPVRESAYTRGTTRELLRRGWSFEGRYLRHILLYLPAEGGEGIWACDAEYPDQAYDLEGREMGSLFDGLRERKLFPAPWPPEQEQERLAPFAQEMIDGLKEEQQRKQEAKSNGKSDNGVTRSS
jgi:hypothetical protein